jgi:hypothetical protein
MTSVRHRSYLHWGLAIVLLLCALGLASCGGAGPAMVETPIGGEPSPSVAGLSREGDSTLNTLTASSMSSDTEAASLTQKTAEPVERVHSSDIATLRLMRTPDDRAFMVQVDNVRDLYAVDVTIRFNPTQWQVADADAERSGIQIKPGEVPRPDFVAVNDVDNAKGIIRYIATQLGDAAAFNGSGTVATILGQAAIAPDTDITIETVTLVNRNAQVIEVVVR